MTLSTLIYIHHDARVTSKSYLPFKRIRNRMFKLLGHHDRYTGAYGYVAFPQIGKFGRLHTNHRRGFKSMVRENIQATILVIFILLFNNIVLGPNGQPYL